jgi:hypothetical protein
MEFSAEQAKGAMTILTIRPLTKNCHAESREQEKMTTSLSGFIEFVRADMGITPTRFPTTRRLFLAYGGAVEWVNPDIASLCRTCIALRFITLGVVSHQLRHRGCIF